MVNVLRPIVAGVDASEDGAWAGAVAWRIAERAGAQCLLVHAVRSVVIPPGGVPGMADEGRIATHMLRVAREQILEYLRGNVPEDSLATVDVRFGAPARVLAETAAECDAGLLVVGGKKHRALGRWLGGSTAHATVRTASIPVLISVGPQADIARVLAAVDLSPAARATIETAQRWAEVFGAELRIMHAIEDRTFAVEYPTFLDPHALEQRVSEVLEERIWPAITLTDAERVVRHGEPAHAIASEVEEWDAHLVVLGSHGRSWVDRLILGSVTERLLGWLPTSLLVVPVRPDSPPADHG